jgi:hypothetical protein
MFSFIIYFLTQKARERDAAPENIRLGWVCLTTANPLTYKATELITTLKSFTVSTRENKKHCCKNSFGENGSSGLHSQSYKIFATFFL